MKWVTGLVLWGWGLRTDGVLIAPTLSLPTSFNNNSNNNKLCCVLFWNIVRVFLYIWNDTLLWLLLYILYLPLFCSFIFENGKSLMPKRYYEFIYSILTLCIFMSRIIYKRLDANHKFIFSKFEKDIKVCTKFSADIQFLKFCRINQILPKFTNFKLCDVSAVCDRSTVK